jgi:hypothetical protein
VLFLKMLTLISGQKNPKNRIFMPNFKGFSMVYRLFAISNFLSEDKTGVDLVPFRGAQSSLNQNIFSNGIKI